jgi:tape measure domain-containing protein
MADLQKTVEIIFAGLDKTGAPITEIETNIRGLGDEATGASPKVGELGDQVEDLGKNGKSAVDELSNAFKGLLTAALIQQIGSAMLDASVEAENLERTFVAITGSSDGAADMMDYIREVAKKLGLDVFETAKAFSSFAAATQGTAIEGDKAKYIFEAVAGTMATLGKSSDDTAGILVQLTQGVSKGKFELEDLKSIAERIPGFFNIMAESLNTTTEELFDMISQGKITGDDMLALAEALKEKYGDVAYVDTFSAAWQRAKNSMTEFLVSAGNSGATDNIKNLLTVLTGGTDAATDGMKALDDNTKEVQESLLKLTPGGTMSLLVEKALAAAATFLKIRDASVEAGTKLEDTGDAGAEAGDQIASGAQTGAEALKQIEASTKAVNEALRELGLDPKQFEDATQVVIDAFDTLVKESQSSGDQVLAGLLMAIDKTAQEALPELSGALDEAFSSGKINAEQYAAGVNAIEVAMAGMWPEVAKATEKTDAQSVSLDKVAAEAKKAEEAANKYALELEKIASNERIKLIESSIELKTAQLEADAKVATAIIDSLSATYAAETKLISDLLGGLTQNANTAADRIKIDFARAAEERVEELHDAQMKLIDAQVAALEAKTAAMAAGNPLITIQGDGLAPHLESMMWEVFRQIQIKMAYDGGDMLVGGCTL